jgi:hypothetical protein
MKKTFPIELDDELHKRVKHAAIDDGMTLHDWVIKVLELKVGIGGTNAHDLGKRKSDRNRRQR